MIFQLFLWYLILSHTGNCTWGMNCRFIHPGVNDKGNYSLISKPEPFPPNAAPPGGPHPLIPNNPWVGWCTWPAQQKPLHSQRTWAASCSRSQWTWHRSRSIWQQTREWKFTSCCTSERRGLSPDNSKLYEPQITQHCSAKSLDAWVEDKGRSCHVHCERSLTILVSLSPWMSGTCEQTSLMSPKPKLCRDQFIVCILHQTEFLCSRPALP